MSIQEIGPNAITVLEKRYLAKDAFGNLCEDISGMFHRVADAIAADKAGEKLSEGYNKVFTCRTLNRDESHPGAMF